MKSLVFSDRAGQDDADQFGLRGRLVGIAFVPAGEQRRPGRDDGT